MKNLLVPLFVFFLFGNSNAQQFKAVEINPFGLSPLPPINDIHFVDLSGDGAFDIMFNSEFSDHFLLNEGSPGNPDFSNASLSQSFSDFDNGQVVGWGNFVEPSSVFTDLDGDGDPDHLSNISSDNPSFPAEFLYEFNTVESAPSGFIYLFSDENPGSDLNLPFIALNSTEIFALADLDGDGDEDILGVRIDDITNAHTFAFYESLYSTGTNSFAGTTVENPFGLTANNNGTETFGFPAFIDPDIDGDQDLLLSLLNGDWAYYENTGDRENPSFAAPVINPFGLTSLPQFGFPAVMELNGDRFPDIIVGSGSFVYYFEFDIPSSTKEIHPDAGLKVFPNPVSNQLTIKSDFEEFDSIEILSVVGQRMRVFDVDKTKDFTVDIEELPTGVYTAKLGRSDLNSYSILKFVKL